MMFIDRVSSALATRDDLTTLDIPDAEAVEWELKRNVVWDVDLFFQVVPEESILRGKLFIRDPEIAVDLANLNNHSGGYYTPSQFYPDLRVRWLNWNNDLWETRFFPVIFCPAYGNASFEPGQTSGSGRMKTEQLIKPKGPPVQQIEFVVAMRMTDDFEPDTSFNSLFASHLVHTKL